MKKSTFLAATLGFLLVMACAGKKEIIPTQSSKVLGGVITMNAEWIKDKGKKFDLRLAISNESKKPIIILLGEMRCSRGDSQGQLVHTFYNTGERTIDFRIGQRKTFNMVCKYGAKSKGDYKITVGQVYEDKWGDGVTKGKVLATNLEWSMPETKD